MYSHSAPAQQPAAQGIDKDNDGDDDDVEHRANIIIVTEDVTTKDFTDFFHIEDEAFKPKPADVEDDDDDDDAAAEDDGPPPSSLFALLFRDVPTSPSEERIEALRRNAVQDPTAHYIKAVESSTARVVGWAKWNLCFDQQQPLEMPWPRGVNLALVDAFSGEMQRARDEYMQGKSYLFMHELVVLPELQGRGIGTKLLEWGLRIADEKRLECWINASADGLSLYKKLGWKEVGQVSIDLGDWGGVKGKREVFVEMVRKPRGKN